MQQRQAPATPATQQTVGATRPTAPAAPVVLDMAALKLVAGGVVADGPHGGWSVAVVDGPHGGW